MLLQSIRALIYVLLWYGASVFHVVCVKRYLKSAPDHVLSVSTIQYIVSCSLGVALCLATSECLPRAWRHDASNDLESTAVQRKGKPGFTSSLALAGVLHALGNLMTNYALGRASVGVAQVIKAMEPIFAVGVASLASGALASWRSCVACLLVVAGAAVALTSDLTFAWTVMLLGLGSNLCLQARNLLSKQLMLPPSDVDGVRYWRPMHVVRVFFLCSAVSLLTMIAIVALVFVCCGGLASVFDVGALNAQAATIGAGFVMFSVSSAFVLDCVQPVTHALLNCIKRLLIVGLGSMALGAQVLPQAWLGIIVAVGGTFLYSTWRGNTPKAIVQDDAIALNVSRLFLYALLGITACTLFAFVILSSCAH
jgi:drug/metabolite transporter (DMT)-like permease